MANANQSCAVCYYFKASDLTCRHSAPIGQETGSPGWIWPVVSATDWCGEFKWMLRTAGPPPYDVVL